MKRQRYRIVATTFAIRSTDGQQIYVQVPIGALVTLMDGPLDSNLLAGVLWSETKFMMFTRDLRQRAEPVASL